MGAVEEAARGASALFFLSISDLRDKNFLARVRDKNFSGTRVG